VEMKQQITVEQLNELSDGGKTVISEWAIDNDYKLKSRG